MQNQPPTSHRYFRKGRLQGLWAATVAAGLLLCPGIPAAPSTHADEARAAAPRAGAIEPLLGIEIIDGPLPVYDDTGSGQMRDPQEGETFAPLRVLLSRERYWEQDGHMDVVVRLHPPEGLRLADTHLRVILRDTEGSELEYFNIDPIPAEQFIFYPVLPEGMTSDGTIELTWFDRQQVIAEDIQSFRVERFDAPAPIRGRIALLFNNALNASGSHLPQTVGVPFPRGILRDSSHLRLVDAAGREIPLQVRETARWSKYGTIKWVLCDFTLNADGEAREVILEYGPDVRRTPHDPISAELGDGFPQIDAGRLRIDDNGLWFDVGGNGTYEKVLGPQALSGAFVEHEDGRIFRAPLADNYAIAEDGSEKVVIFREGWYLEQDGDGRFCKYITRYVIHRDSPLIRIFHSWIFTGDGNSDRIRNMGWQFPLAGGMAADGILTGFGDTGEWAAADALVQWDFDHFNVLCDGAVETREGGRAAGVAAAADNKVVLYLGVKDFWQNYPSELEVDASSLWFHNWPRHNPPAGYTFEGELITTRGAPALASAARHQNYTPGTLTRSEWKLNAVQARFAHEGELLDFRLPDAFGEETIANTAMRVGRSSSHHWEPGDVETVNAQGISRTEEMWLYLTPPEADRQATKQVLESLNSGDLHVVADPRWVAASGALYEMHHQDWEKYPEEERAYELLALSVGNVAERLGAYGMWIYGDLPAWHPQLDVLEPNLYRAYRKEHHGWPFTWKAYARSGDPRMLKLAEASTRQMIDANYSHYYDDEVQALIGENRVRRIGRWRSSALPWMGSRHTFTRSLGSQVDFLWRAYYISGYERARDNALSFAEQTKIEEPLPGRSAIGSAYMRDRASISLLKSYLETYEATFDPWFLVAAHAIAEGHLDNNGASWAYGEQRYPRLWETADREYVRFTGSEAFKDHYLGFARLAADERSRVLFSARTPQFPPKAFAWSLTGDDFYLRRIAAGLNHGTAVVHPGDDPWYLQGYPASQGQHTAYSLHAPYYLRWMPVGLWALEQAGEDPEPLFRTFWANTVTTHDRFQEVIIQKPTADAMPLIVDTHRHSGTPSYTITGPDGAVISSGVLEREDKPWPDPWQLLIPEDAPAGEYRLRVEFEEDVHQNQRLLSVPVSPADNPEVFHLEDGARMFGSRDRYVQLWFKVPEGTTGFWINFFRSGYAAIWDPDGERVFSLPGNASDATYPMQVDIEVDPDQAGRLWQITLPGHTLFLMDPAIPPVYSTSPSRWFMPESAATALPAL